MLVLMYPLGYWVVVSGSRWLAELLGDFGVTLAFALALNVANVLLLWALIRRTRLRSRKWAKRRGMRSSGGIDDPWLDRPSSLMKRPEGKETWNEIAPCRRY
jgi:hypothetical protein